MPDSVKIYWIATALILLTIAEALSGNEVWAIVHCIIAMCIYGAAIYKSTREK